MQRPWNIANLPVYSLATYSEKNEVNMNICTYVTAVSMKPKLYSIAIYNDTKSLENMLQTEQAVLQVLQANQYKLVTVLGKKSGLKINKNNWLEKNNLVCEWNNYKVLKNVAALVELKKVNSMQTGDHHLHIFEALKYKTFSDEVLYTQILSDHSIIRI